MKILESYLIAFALMNACGRKTTDIFTILFFATAYVFVKKVPRSGGKKEHILSTVCAMLFTGFYVLGNMEALTGGLTNKLFLLFYLGCTVIGLFCLFYRCVLWVLKSSTRIVLFEENRKFPTKMFLLCSVILVICMVPLWLANYPAIMTPDSLSQYRQATGISAYSDHHPWFHTLLFKLFYSIGYAFSKNVYSAIACYTFAQMLLMAFGVSYVWATLYEMGLKKKFYLAGVALYVIYPYNLIYAVTIWKDVLFSMAVMIFTVTLFRMYCQMKASGLVKNRDWILYLISGFLMCMLRHNGFYAFVAAAPFVLWFYREIWKKILPVTMVVLVACILIKGPVMSYAQVVPGQLAYKLGVPLQQIGRVVADGCYLTEEETAQIEKINIISYVKENYQRGGADPMTAWVEYGNQKYLEDHKGEYLKLWLSLGIKYPGKYIQAFIDLTKGYWYPMAPEQVVFFGITPNQDGLELQPLLKGPVVIKIQELLTKLYTIFPIYGIIYSMGAMFWFFILLMAIAIRNNNHGVWIAGIPLLFLTGTLLLAVPLVADLRYAYPLMLSILSVAAITFKNTKENKNEEFYE